MSSFISVVASYLLEYYSIGDLTALSQSEIVIAYFIATLLMWGIRIVVKTLHDVSKPSENAVRILIYGAMTSGVGLAKNIRSQKFANFQLCGFISHNKRASHMTLLGEKVYNIDDNLKSADNFSIV